MRGTESGALAAGTSLPAGLLSGAAVGLVGALASAPLRQLAGVSDRAVVNGVTVAGGALVVWLLIGVLHEKLTRLPSPSDAVGKTQTIAGDIYLQGGKGLAATAPSSVSVDLCTLTTDSPMRDGFIKMDTLQTNRFPMATFTLSGIDGFPARTPRATRSRSR